MPTFTRLFRFALALTVASSLLMGLTGCSKKEDLPTKAEGYYDVKLKKSNGEGG